MPCKLDTWSRYLDTSFILNNCMFGPAKLTKNADPDKYLYIGYGIGFNARSQFLRAEVSCDKNVIIFVTDMSSFVHAIKRNMF